MNTVGHDVLRTIDSRSMPAWAGTWHIWTVRIPRARLRVGLYGAAFGGVTADGDGSTANSVDDEHRFDPYTRVNHDRVRRTRFQFHKSMPVRCAA